MPKGGRLGGTYIHSSVGRRNSVGGTEIESQVTDRQNSKAGTGTGYMGMDKRRGGGIRGELGWAEAATVSVELAHNNAASSMQNGWKASGNASTVWPALPHAKCNEPPSGTAAPPFGGTASRPNICSTYCHLNGDYLNCVTVFAGYIEMFFLHKLLAIKASMNYSGRSLDTF